MGRPKKEPGAMLDMAAPEILAKMEKPEEPRQRRMRKSRGFEKAQREAARPVVVAKPEAHAEDGDDPFAEARRPVKGKGFRVGELDDYEELVALPQNGKCTCGTKPLSWTNASGYSQSKRNPNIGFFCPHTAHGGNGRFWLFSEIYEPKKRGRPRKVKIEVQGEQSPG